MNIVYVLPIKHFPGASYSQSSKLLQPGPSYVASISKVPAPSLSAVPQSAPMPKPAALAMVQAVEVYDRTSLHCLHPASSLPLPEEGHKMPQVPQDTGPEVASAAAPVVPCSGSRGAEPQVVPAAASVAACSRPLRRAEPLVTPGSEQVGKSLLSLLKLLCGMKK